MSIVFAALTPHPPVLIPEIGKAHTKKLAKTAAAFHTLEHELYAAKPESLVLISPHGTVLADDFTINLNADYTIGFKEFGDFSVALNFKSDYLTIQEMRSVDEGQHRIPIVLASQQELDHGFGVPLFFLTSHLKQVPIIPITYSALGIDEHVQFGEFLHQQLSRIEKRFAVIASGDLSHRLTKGAPGGYSAQAARFDKKVIDSLKKNDLTAITKIDKKIATEAGECGWRALAILAGVVQSMNVTIDVLSYEKPFGVGYAVAHVKLP